MKQLKHKHDIDRFFDILTPMIDKHPKIPWYIRFLNSWYYWLVITALGLLIIWCFANL